MTTKVEVAIIGASIGGASAAHIIGRAGRSVLLVDKGRFPRSKPCGEGLCLAGLRVAQRIGVWSRELPHLPFEGFKVSRGGRWYPLTIKAGGGVSIERVHLDHHLLTLARSHRALLVEEGDRPLVSRDGIGFRVEVNKREYSAAKVILADGARSLTAQHLAPTDKLSTTARQRNAAAVHFTGHFDVPPTMVHIMIGSMYELYATPLPGGRLNVAVLTASSGMINPREVLLDNRMIQPLFDEMKFYGTRDSEILGRAGVGSFYPRRVPPGVFLVGDAREQFDPIGGMGMTHAFMSAELAAQSVLGEGRNENAVQWFERRRDHNSRRLRRFTSLTHYVMHSSRRMNFVLPLMSSRIGSAVASCFCPRDFGVEKL